MATLSILGYGLSQGTTLTKTSNMSNGVQNQQEGVNLTKASTFSKITVQNVLSESYRNSMNIGNNSSPSLNSTNAIVRKIKDFGMVGAVNNAGANAGNATNSVSKSLLIRKRPLVDTKNNLNESNNKTVQASAKKLKQSKDEKEPKEQTQTTKAPKKLNNENLNRQKKAVIVDANGVVIPKPAGTPGRKGLPLPQAVARRNARERNRVKQVNNGFAALRERIPEEVAEAFETQGTTRGSNIKKLSKVETLRMAVEYIRSLERLLGFDFPTEASGNISQQYSSSSGEDSYSIIKDEFDTLSPNMDDNLEDSLSHYDMDDFFAKSTNGNSTFNQPELLDNNLSSTNPIDMLPNITTLHGLQYIRIPGTNTYQLLTPDIFVGTTHSPPNSSLDDEQFNSLIDTNHHSPTAAAAAAAAAVGSVGLTSPAQATTANTQSINMATTTITATTITPTLRTTKTAMTAPASPNTAIITSTPISTGNGTATTFENGKPVAVSLSRLTPVPQMLPTTTATATTSSPNASSSLLYHQQQTAEPSRVATLSPAVNEASSQACATANVSEMQAQFVAPTLPHLLPHIIKQEYCEKLDFDSTTKSPNAIATNNVYQTTQAATATTTAAAGDLHEHATIQSMSPPLDRCNRLLIAPQHAATIELQSFYEQDDSGSFYETNLNFKKDLDDVLLDASSATNTGLSDESMIESIDWWEAHTPQSDGSNAVML